MQHERSTRRHFLKTLGSLAAVASTGRASAQARPNIVWISTEDINAHLGCYGVKHAVTPNLDALAAGGVRYDYAFTTSGVCAPVRSGIITGMYVTTIGTQNMRAGGSGSKTNNVPKKPKAVRCFTEYLRDAGYYCANNSKEDYQFKAPPGAWDDSSGSAHWRKRKPGQPFFFVRNFTMTHEGPISRTGAEHEAIVKRLKPEDRQDPAVLELPPYYPDTPVCRETWANYFECITAMDYEAGDLLRELEADGLAEDTIVFFWGDHGVGLPRAKRWLYDSGTRIPLIVRIPEKWRVGDQGKPGTASDRMVSSIDFAPTVLNLLGVPLPEQFQGQAFLGPNLPPPRKYIYGVRDRMDERYDIIRSVRDKYFRYIRNYEPYKAYYQYMNTPEKGAIMQELRKLHAEGKLPPAAELFMADHKPVEEFYDLERDPHEINNLIDAPEYQGDIVRLRAAHVRWVNDTRDLGLLPEPEMVARAEKFGGDRYAALREAGSRELFLRLERAAALAGESNPENRLSLEAAMKDSDAAVRYWGAIGLGNLGKGAAASEELLRKGLEDAAPVVRVAAARALCHGGIDGPAVPVLIEELASPHEWVRLNAATVLDAIGEQARPAIPAMQEALKDTENKYVVRVANRALNQLLGTNNSVP